VTRQFITTHGKHFITSFYLEHAGSSISWTHANGVPLAWECATHSNGQQCFGKALQRLAAVA
jgi:hypothetical protein